MTKLVSIIMNCFNGEAYLREALDSIINQTYQNWELIFWDNKSTDNSLKILSTYKDERIRCFISENHGTLGDGRSQAIKKIKGDFIAFLDTDDIWYKNRLEESIKEFNRSDDICLVYSNTHFFNEKMKKKLYKEIKPSGYITNKLLVNYNLSLESVTINNTHLKKLEQMFDNQFSHIADFDLFLRISSLGKCRYINKVLSGWRVHENNDSFKRPYLFIKERKDWISKYENEKIFKPYKNEIRELNMICSAEEKLNNNNIFAINNILELSNHNFIEKRNMIKFIISCIPILKNIYRLKKLFKI